MLIDEDTLLDRISELQAELDALTAYQDLLYLDREGIIAIDDGRCYPREKPCPSLP